jgi:methylase of polypeptide subunit release factors
VNGRNRVFEVERAQLIPGSKSKLLLQRLSGIGWVLDFDTANVFISGAGSGNATLEQVCRFITDNRCTVDILVDDIEPHKVRVAGFAILE